MSRASKLTLAGTSLFAAGTVVFVHFQQQWEKSAMHEGVIRDMEQQRVKKERQLDFDMQRALEEEYKKEQAVRDTNIPVEFLKLRSMNLRYYTPSDTSTMAWYSDAPTSTNVAYTTAQPPSTY
ncbi:uncharacterized protein BCR38DRAFT_479286 [Pseudomassariella vexata]|uniref:Cytochrome c oxidase assembly protein n=1 Tax=Pseudomassariella vexata TaxID=1141098 RepID=A0A1Y2D6S4_9PEZI|nr:uncharacterized protein BCR38DRAFT_479286 [Pseudomassariella vexata]ORY54980.1 hypothetical protein BCR38DRAFT_479286 [Pseudomassariella vexata]